MTIIDNDMLWRQFGATIDMLGDALRDCPDELWEKRLWEDQRDQWVAAGFSTFWYLGYHTLFWLDLYLTGAEEGFAPPEPFDLVEMEAGEVAAADLYTRRIAPLSGILPPKVPGDNRRSVDRNRLAGCAGSAGESCRMRSCSFTICVMCKSMAHNCACSWDSRREKPQGGLRRLRKSLVAERIQREGC